ncbi:hypothetical protein DCMF_17305 [Candidatus Formimonas warabiya]|uniref:Uncharacterized protein n=1 Tax=Formimonas warabiya TaxID=1761012 RepID=A0A3G1KV15_FORW1|nr:hypothetical protein DCMF_17305 [Candidatus Formimonas warabiya]
MRGKLTIWWVFSWEMMQLFPGIPGIGTRSREKIRLAPACGDGGSINCESKKKPWRAFLSIN